MTVQKKDGLQMLTEAMQTGIKARWQDVEKEVLTRDGTGDNINIAADTRLQELIVRIYENYIPAFSQQVWTEYQLNTSSNPTPELADMKDKGNQLVINYSCGAFRRIYDHLSKTLPEKDHSYLKAQSLKLLGAIIDRSARAFNETLEQHMKDYVLYQALARVNDWAVICYVEGYQPPTKRQGR